MKATHALAALLRFLGERLRVGHIVVCNGSKEFLLVLSIEGWLTHQHLIQQYSIRPPVHTFTIWLVQDDLSMVLVKYSRVPCIVYQ